MTYRPGPSHRFPPDWRPPKPREPSDRTRYDTSDDLASIDAALNRLKEK